MGRTNDKLRQAVVDVLGARAMPEGQIVEELVDRGVEFNRSRLDRLMVDDTSFAEVTDGMIHVPSVLEGTAWTVRVDAEDAAKGFVRTHPHLSPMTWWLLEDDVRLVGEAGQMLGTLEVDDEWLDGEDTDILLGPDGWLDELAGGWATVTVERGTLRWTPCSSPPDATDAQIAAVRAGFDRATRHETIEVLDDAPVELRFTAGSGPIYEAVLADRAAFVDEPIPPLPELYQAAGLEERGKILAEVGFDWDALRAWQDRRRYMSIHQLDDTGAEQLAGLIGAYRSAEGLGGEVAILVAEVLEAGDVAEAFWAETVLREDSVADLGRFVDTVVAQLDGTLPVGLAWLTARCLDRTGETTAAIATLEQAVGTDSQHAPALVELAGFASDRGDAQVAFRLLQRAGVTTLADDDVEPSEGEQLLAEIAPFALHRPRPAAKRNDPCPCGSGRKYKACHLGREQHRLDERSLWLYAKASRFLRQQRPDEVATVAAEMVDPVEQYVLYRQLRSSPVAIDLALQHGAFADFLAARDGLLPDDEALLAAQWALVEPGVFEVERAGNDRLELRNIGRGERITIVNTTADPRTRRGTVLFGRPLPVSGLYRAFGGFMGVPRSIVGELQDAIDDGDPLEIAAVLGETLRPPRMANTDGHALVLHTLRWHITDPAAVDAALRAAGLVGDDDEPAWRLERDTANMPNAIVATLRLEGLTLVGEVNSDDRADELRALVAGALSDAELVADETRTLDEAMDDYDPDDAPEPLDQNDPAIRRIIEQHVIEMEQRWLDEPIPALGGSTPRQAAADPVGREELTQLLDSFPSPAPDIPGTFDPDRLRRALGL